MMKRKKRKRISKEGEIAKEEERYGKRKSDGAKK